MKRESEVSNSREGNDEALQSSTEILYSRDKLYTVSLVYQLGDSGKALCFVIGAIVFL